MMNNFIKYKAMPFNFLWDFYRVKNLQAIIPMQSQLEQLTLTNYLMVNEPNILFLFQ